MDHFNQRRHRLNPDEMDVVFYLLLDTLDSLAKHSSNPVKANEVYRILWRFEYNKPGRPAYPDFTWERACALLDHFRELEEQSIRERFE